MATTGLRDEDWVRDKAQEFLKAEFIQLNRACVIVKSRTDRYMVIRRVDKSISVFHNRGRWEPVRNKELIAAIELAVWPRLE